MHTYPVLLLHVDGALSWGCIVAVDSSFKRGTCTSLSPGALTDPAVCLEFRAERHSTHPGRARRGADGPEIGLTGDGGQCAQEQDRKGTGPRHVIVLGERRSASCMGGWVLGNEAKGSNDLLRGEKATIDRLNGGPRRCVTLV